MDRLRRLGSLLWRGRRRGASLDTCPFTLLEELGKYAQPLYICSPAAFRVQFTVDINEGVFVHKHASLRSTTFTVSEATDVSLVIKGRMDDGTRWEVLLWKNTPRCDHKYGAQVRVGAHTVDNRIVTCQLAETRASWGSVSDSSTTVRRLHLRRCFSDGRRVGGASF